MFISPNLRKGDIEVRIKAPRDLVQVIDAIALACGVTRQDVVLGALDSFTKEQLHIANVMANSRLTQRNRSGNDVE